MAAIHLISWMDLYQKNSMGFDLVANHSNSQFVIYQSENGQIRLEVRLEDETVWLPQKLMAELFQTSKRNISLHLENVFEEQELVEEAVVKDFLTTASDGKNYSTNHYNLDAIFSSATASNPTSPPASASGRPPVCGSTSSFEVLARRITRKEKEQGN